ncbi:MAG: 4'-phosphopantetheinyl transferase superfamily protein [Chloroflexota bacterium]
MKNSNHEDPSTSLRAGTETRRINFSAVDGRPTLKDGEVHVWLADLNRPDLTEAAREILTPAEIERGHRYRFERDQTWFFARHFFLRALLSRYLDQRASIFDIRHSAHGKPYLDGHPLYFNLSDSNGWCLLAFTRVAPLGVDLEHVRERGDLMAVARRYFSPAEFAELEKLPSEEQLDGFYHIWTQKEAFIKAVGEGMSIPLDSFDVEMEPGQPGGIRAIRGTRSGRWAMRTFVPREGFRGAVCVGGEVKSVKFFNREEREGR